MCEPATFSERKNILELSHGGVLVLKQKIDLEGWDGNRTISTLENGSGHERQEIKLEYLLATFGVKVNQFNVQNREIDLLNIVEATSTWKYHTIFPC